MTVEQGPVSTPLTRLPGMGGKKQQPTDHYHIPVSLMSGPSKVNCMEVNRLSIF